MPASWVDAALVPSLPGWQLGFSSVTSPTNERTFVPYLLPRAAVGNSTPLIRVAPAAAGEVPALLAMLSAFCFDYLVRQKVGGVNLNYFIVRQLPVLPPPAVRPFGAFCADRVLELTYTAHDMAAFARGLGDHGPPFRWDAERRFAHQGRARRAVLPAVRDRPGRRGLHHGHVHRGTEGRRRPARPVPDQGGHPGLLRPDGVDAAGALYRTAITPPPRTGPRHPLRGRPANGQAAADRRALARRWSSHREHGLPGLVPGRPAWRRRKATWAAPRRSPEAGKHYAPRPACCCRPLYPAAWERMLAARCRDRPGRSGVRRGLWTASGPAAAGYHRRHGGRRLADAVKAAKARPGPKGRNPGRASRRRPGWARRE